MARRQPRDKYFPLTGGLDLVTSPLKVEPGKLLSSSNYEQGILGGYTRIQGFERIDGRPIASEASYWLLNFDSGGLVEVEAESQAVGQTSGATGRVLLVVLTSGTWAGGDAAGYVIFYNVSGTFQDDEEVSYTGANPGFSVGFSNGFS